MAKQRGQSLLTKDFLKKVEIKKINLIISCGPGRLLSLSSILRRRRGRHRRVWGQRRFPKTRPPVDALVGELPKDAPTQGPSLKFEK